GRETGPGPVELLRAVEPLECAEQFVDVGHVEAGAVVTHEVRGTAVMRDAPDLDARSGTLPRELPGILEQVLQDHAHETGIRGDVEPRRDRDIDAPRRVALPEVLGDARRE